MVRVILRITNTGTTNATGVSASDPFNGTTLVPNSVRITPIAVNDSFNITGNTPITFTAAQLLGNDLDPLGNIATLTVTAVGGATNGSIVNNGNGTFTFTPTTGLDIGQTASFNYTITDQEGLTNVSGFNGVVTLNVTDVVWHVDSAYTGANGVSDGSFLRPFTSLTELNGVTGDGTTGDDVDSANEAIFINNRGSNYAAGIVLETGQRLFGDGLALTVNGTTLGVSASNSTINFGTGNGITLASNNTIGGISLNGTAAGGTGIIDSGATVGTLTISGTSISGTGRALAIQNGGALNASFDTLSSTGSSTQGVLISGGATGTLTATSGTISNSTSFGFQLGTSTGGTGGTINVTYAGAISQAGAAAAAVRGRTGGTATFSGAISDTAGGTSSQIDVANNTGGTVNFTGSVNVATTSQTAVSLTNNGGTTINFNTTGTGLDIVTTAGGTGLSATGGGTVNITGAGNSVSTGNGTAINIANTTIGGSGVRFDSVNTTGAASGIILNTTGAGTFTVSGTGGANTGGTIANSTGAAGVLLTSTGPVSLTGLSVTGSANDGLNGTTVNGLTLSGVTISNNGNAANERGVYVNGLTGTATITGSTFSGNADHNVNLINNGGTLNLTVATSTFSNSNNATTGNDGLLLESNGTAITTASITGSTFNNNRGDHFQFATNGTGGASGSQNNLTFSGNTLTTTDSTNILGGGVTISPSGGDDLIAAINNNTITGTVSGAAINLVGVSTISGGNIQATIQGNNIGTAGVANSGTSGGAFGINAEVNGNGIVTTLINNNIVREVSGSFGIAATARAGTGTGGTLNATITGNTVTATATTGLINGINVTAGVSTGGDREVLNAQISGNTINAGLTTNIRVRALSNSTASGDADFNLRGYTGGATDTAAVATYLSGQNGGTTASAALLGGNNTGSFNNTPGGAAPTQPGTPASPQLALAELPAAPNGNFDAGSNQFDYGAAPLALIRETLGNLTGPFGDGVRNNYIEVQIAPDGTILGTSQSPVFQTQFIDPAAVLTPETIALLTPPSVELTPLVAAQTATLDEATLDQIVEAAIARWIAAGATEAQVAALRSVDFSISNLPGIHLGSATPGGITIDSDGAGFGWFIDTTPGDDVEFAGTGTARAGLEGGAATRIDLLTVVLHEPGHTIGLEDTYLSSDRENLLYGYITPGERRLPAVGQAIGARPGSVTAEAFALAPTLIGSLPAGKAVEISFDSTVNAASNQVITHPSSASTISGTNFANVTSNTQTLVIDTLTLSGRVFLDANRDGTRNGAETGVNAVALTLFADTDNNGVFTSGTDVQLATATTGATGIYEFLNLAPGNYIVRVDAGNFTGAGALVGRVATVFAGDPDNNVANDSNAAALSGGISTTQAITLAYNSEPTAGIGNDVNATLDLGFLVPNTAPNYTSTAPQQSFTENGLFTLITTSVTLSDDQTNFSGGTLTVQIATGATSGDELRIRPAEAPSFGIEVVGTNVRFNGTQIGTIAASTTTSFIIALNANATINAVSALTQAFEYRSTSDNPTNTNRVVTYTLQDGQGTLGGGADTTTLTRTITVVPVDDAPIAGADNGTVNASATTSIAVLANDSDVDGPTPSIATINGVALAVGASTTLASGAVVTRNADGTIGYNPNGAFDFLVSAATAAGTGAANAQAVDSFQYALAGGGTATVSVTVNGVDGPGDQLRGNTGNNTITGTNGVDFFNLSQGGNDTVSGGSSNDAFYFGAAFAAGDTVDGGDGTNDQVALQGNYNDLTFAANAFTNVEVLALLSRTINTFGGGAGSAFAYNLTFTDANVAAGQQLTIFAGSLVAGENLMVNAGSETDGSYRIFAGQGSDTIDTGAGNDGVFFGPGAFNTGTDFINTGAGTNDQVALDGNYTFTVGDLNFRNVEVLSLFRGIDGDLGNYNLTFSGTLVGSGQTFTVFALPVITNLTLDASSETTGNYRIIAGSGNDTISTGGGSDSIFGGLGGDIMDAGSGSDTFVYNGVSESTGNSIDRIIGFVSGSDRFDLAHTVTGIAASVTTGSLSTASFNTDLAAAIGAGQLGVGQAVLFTASSGTRAGQTFVVVDANGIAGYQSDSDYVIQLSNPPASLTVADFI